MGQPIVNGTLEPILQPVETTFDRQRGSQVIYRYACASKTGLNTLADTARISGYSGRLVAADGNAILEVSTPNAAEGANDVTDTWQIVGNEISESVYANPIVKAKVSSIDRKVIRCAIKNNISLSDAAEKLGEEDAAFYDEPTSSTALMFYEELVKGQDSYNVGQYVLRHTTNAPANSTANISDVNVEKIYTTAQLISEVTDSGLWVNPIPNRLYAKIMAIEPMQAQNDDESEFYLWGWKKSPSTETVTPSNRVEIATEYTLYLWSLLRYGVAA
jgi:hypothetical protein